MTDPPLRMQVRDPSYELLMRQLDARLARIEHSLERLGDVHEGRHEHIVGRISTLENKNSEFKGGWTVLTIIGTIAGAIGGLLTKWFGHG